jgi:type I restriction enzyme R subunit
MNTGIEDGFLANFILHRYRINTDTNSLRIEDAVEEGAKIEVPDGAELQEEYGARQFELDALLPDRTILMCTKLAEILTKTGEMAKTIIFCVTQDHARQVTKLIQNHFNHLGYSNYAVTIVSEENDVESLVKAFQDEQTERPVVASTVDLLSTGFDAPSVKNIVFMKYVSSTIVFKQILGRGSRISADREKYFFRLIDFTNATRLLSEWETGGGDNFRGNRSGENMLCGYVYDKESAYPIHAARIVLQLSPNQQKVELTNEIGYFVFYDLPDGEVFLQASANKYRNIQMKISTKQDLIEPLTIDLLKQGVPAKPIKVTGLKVEFDEETIFEVNITGQRLTLKEYIDYTKQKVTEKYPNAEDLRENWSDRSKRKEVVEELEKAGINTEILANVTQQPEADELDLLSNIAYNKEVHTRTERAEAMKNMEQQFINSFNNEQKNILLHLLLYYQLNGINELDNPNVFNLFLRRGVQDAKEKFGSMPLLINTLTEFQKRLYTR